MCGDCGVYVAGVTKHAGGSAEDLLAQVAALTAQAGVPQLVGIRRCRERVAPGHGLGRCPGKRFGVGTRFLACLPDRRDLLWFDVGMYLRQTKRTNRDGSTVAYLQLAHNERHLCFVNFFPAI